MLNDIHPFVSALSVELDRWAARRAVSVSLEMSDRGVLVRLADGFELLVSPRRLQLPHYGQTACFDLAYLSSKDQLSPKEQRALAEVLEVVADVEERVELDGLLQVLEGFSVETVPDSEPAPCPPCAPGRTATLKMHQRCNIECVFCKEDEGGPLSHPDGLAEIEELLRKLRQDGIETISFDGGEPTLSQLLPEGIQLARQLGFRHVQVVSNGIRLASTRFLQSLLDAGLDRINLSLHAIDARTSRAIHGVDIHKRQLRALEVVRDMAPDIGLTISTVLIAENSGSLGALLELAVSYRPEHIAVIYCLPSFFGGRFWKTRLADLEDGQVLRAVQAFVAAHPDQPVQLRHFPYCHVPEAMWPNIRGRGERAATAPSSAKPGRASPNRRLCGSCSQRHACGFPLHGYLLQHRPVPTLLRGAALGVLGIDVLSRGFRA